MEAKLTTISGTVNPIAQINLTGNFLDLKAAVKELLKLQPQDPLINLEAAVLLHLGKAPLTDVPGPAEPETNKVYLLSFYIDRLLHSSFLVRHLGHTESRQWFAFQYLMGNTIEGQETHLFNATEANFPNYTAEPYPGTTITEQYILIQ